jgi:hypothetical protein
MSHFILHGNLGMDLLTLLLNWSGKTKSFYIQDSLTLFTAISHSAFRTNTLIVSNAINTATTIGTGVRQTLIDIWNETEKWHIIQPQT